MSFFFKVIIYYNTLKDPRFYFITVFLKSVLSCIIMKYVLSYLHHVLESVIFIHEIHNFIL